MAILKEEQQQEILLSYQRDYGLIILAYNKLNIKENINDVGLLIHRAAKLRNEIIRDSHYHKNCFSEYNAEFAINIANSIDNFIMSHTIENVEAMLPEQGQLLSQIPTAA